MAKSEGRTGASKNRAEARKRKKQQRRRDGGHGSKVWLKTRKRVRRRLLER